jgi:hypothetical protein
MPDLSNPAELATLLDETAKGAVQWTASRDGRERHGDREGDAPTLRGDVDGRLTLAVKPGGEMSVDVIADSMNPELAEPLAQLWDATSRY